jgi:DNA uptake protein ComE-like DNA-binding protein
VANTAVTGFSYSGNASAGTLTLTGASGTIGSLAFSGSYSTSNFSTVSDGHGGTDILYDPTSAMADVAAEAPAAVKTLSYAGSDQEVTLGGTAGVDILDIGNALRINIASSTQTDTISGFGTNDANAVLDLKNGAGGYTSVAEIAKALHSDGNGGTMLLLGATGSIDFLGTKPSQLHASNFAVG